MENKEKIMLPMPVRRAEAAEKIVQAINDISEAYSLPYFALDDILYRIAGEIHAGAVKEYRNARANYDKLIKERNENELRSEKGVDADNE